MTLVAWGGVGKTSLVATWLAGLAARDHDGADFFDWTFYSQGARDSGSASADTFIDVALRFFGDTATADSPRSPWDKGARLASLVAERRTLLVLDGLEPLQHPPGPLAGELKDPAITALLKGLAARNAGLCVVTTRESIKDLAASHGSTAPEWELEHLSTPAGVALLKHLGVDGAREELETLVDDVRGHALTLNLIGRFLKDAHGGDVRKRDLVRFQEADDEVQGGHAFRVMEAYERWLVPPRNWVRRLIDFVTLRRTPELEEGRRQLAILRILGLFDRPASPDCLAALRKPPAIAGLTHALVGLTDAQWSLSVSRLAECGLLAAPTQGGALDAHPLVRDHFGRRLRERNEDAWKAAHGRLFDHLKDTTDHRPDTLAGLGPLYQAVVHGCLAGRQQEACVDVYRDRILRGTGNDGFYSTSKLGAFGADLGAVACFFEPPWSRVSPSLTEAARAWLLNMAAFRLRALGRLTEAVEPMRAGLQVFVAAKNWQQAALAGGNLSELKLTLGDVAGSVRDAEESVLFADRSGDPFQRMGKRTTHADALHAARRRGEALALFREAEAMQAEQQPQYRLLTSLQGFRYCDLLLAGAERAAAGGRRAAGAPGECSEVERRAAQALPIAEANRWLLDVALDQLTFGRARLYGAILDGTAVDDAATEIEQAVDGLRRAGQLQFIPLGLLTRAWLRSVQGDPDGASADLDEAQEIAERGPMPLHLADVHLHRALFFGDRRALEKARALIDEHGYGRRREELADAEEASRSWPDPIPERSSEMDRPSKRFRIALSFAGEHRPFVERVAARLAGAVGKDRVLYDAYYEAEFARVDLDTYLQRLYHDESELIAIFLSAHYERKEWCGLEWRAIRDLIKKRQGDSVMPLRFDATEIPGLFSGDGYVSIREREPETIADLILHRLGLAAPPEPPPTPPPNRPKKAALATWQEKLAFLEEQEVIAVDPDAKFRLRKLIAEARAKIREHRGEA